MKTKSCHSLMFAICLLVGWLMPGFIWASVEVDGIYYDLNTSAKTAAVASHPDKYSGGVFIPESFEYKGSTYRVTSIGSTAFLDCSGMTGINMPGSVTTIAPSAFERCTGLTTLYIGKGVTTIDYEAFNNCSNLTTLFLPASVKTIGNQTFAGCSSLSEIIVERTTAPTIVSTTFNGVDKTTCKVYVPEGYKSVYSNVSYWKDFTIIIDQLAVLDSGSCGDNVSYTIYSDMSMVISGTGAMWDRINDYNPDFKTLSFSRSNIAKSIVIEDGVTSISERAFQDFSSLTSIKIPNSVTRIDAGAFHGCCSLTSLNIPSSVVHISEYNELYGVYHNYWEYAPINIFSGCNSLISISVDPANPTYDSRNNCNAIIESSSNTLLAGCNNSVIPNNVTDIGEYAFYQCNGLRSVSIPDGVTNIGKDAFYSCENLTSVIIPNSLTSIKDETFAGCIRLTAIMIPNSVTSIGHDAFAGCTGLTTIEIPNSVTSISGSAFSGCTGLTSIEIPNSVTSIGTYAFSDCTGLTSITVGWETPLDISLSHFYNVDKTVCILCVPYGTKSAYESAYAWKEFENIVEYGEEPDTDLSTLANAIYVNQTEGRIGGTMDIPVKMKNDFDVRGFQFTMELPEGAVINSWALSTDRLPSGVTTSDKMATQSINGNKIVVVCSLNYGNATFTGNDGEIATVNVTFPDDMEAGSYPIYLTACASNDASGFYNPELSDVKATLVLEDYLPGDANGDGKVMVGDVTAILNYIVGSAPDGFNAKAADVNGDGKVMVGDVTAVLNIIVNQ